MGACEISKRRAPFSDQDSTTGSAEPRCTREKCPGCRPGARRPQRASHQRPTARVPQNPDPKPDWQEESPGLVLATAALEFETTWLDGKRPTKTMASQRKRRCEPLQYRLVGA